jgi:hypothetical protein
MAENWEIQKKQIRSEGGMVACQNWLAAEAGAAVLRRGGNAMDAAVTTALTWSVVSHGFPVLVEAALCCVRMAKTEVLTRLISTWCPRAVLTPTIIR